MKVKIADDHFKPQLFARMRVYLGMKNWFTRRPVLAWSLVIMVVMLAGFVLGIRPSSALTRYKQELVTRGEALKWSQLAPEQNPEVLQFYQEMIHLSSGLIDRPLAFGALNYEATATNGLATPLRKKLKPAGTDKGTWSDLREQLHASESSLAELRILLTNRPSGSRYDAKDPFGSFGPSSLLIAKRRTAQAFAASTILHLHEEQLPEALRDLDALLNLAQFNEPTPLLVDQMIQVAISGLALAVTWEAMQTPGWTEPQLSALAGKLANLEFATRLPRVIEAERAGLIASLEVSKGKKGGIMRLFTTPSQSWSLAEHACGAIYDLLFAENDELHYLRHTQQLLDEIRPAVATTNHSALLAGFTNAVHRIYKQATWHGRFRFPLTQLGTPNWQRAAVTVIKHETRRRLALTAIALHRHMLRNGSLPNTLANLPPELLPHAFDDTFGNGLLKYQRIAPTRFILHSPGENGQDESGRGDDIIWPAPASISSPD